MPLWHAAPPRGAAATGLATGCPTGAWPGIATGLGTAGFFGAAGLTGADPTGAGAGWAHTADEMTSEAAMVAITTRLGEGIGINVTGSEKEEVRICTAFRQDQCKRNPLKCLHIPKQTRASPLGA